MIPGGYFRLLRVLCSLIDVGAALVTRLGVDCSWPALRFISSDIRFRVMTRLLIRCALAEFRVVIFGVLVPLSRVRRDVSDLLVTGLGLDVDGDGSGSDSDSDSDSDSAVDFESTTITGGTRFSLTEEVLSVGLFVFFCVAARRELVWSRRCCLRSGELRGEGAAESLDRREREFGSEGVRLSTLFRPFRRGVSRCRTFR